MDSITVPHEKIDQLRKHFDEAYDSLEDAQWQVNKELLEKLYNITGKDKVMQTKRGIMKRGTDARKLVAEILEPFNIKAHPDGWHINYARGFLPIAMHVDIPEHDTNHDGDTILIPLTFDDRIKTLWWKCHVYEAVFDFWIEKQDWPNKQKLNNISEKYDLSNGFWRKPEIVDYMPLDGIGDWSKGNVFKGRRSQPHCSNNFLTSGISHKDYILIQTQDQDHRSE